MHFPALLVLLIALVFHVQCKTTIIVPGPNPNLDSPEYSKNPKYDIGQQVDVTWESNYNRFDLYLIQSYPAEASFQLAGNTTSKKFQWTGSLDNTTRRAAADGTYVFWFTLHAYNNNQDECGSTEDADSMYFNITEPQTGFTTREIAGITAGSVVGGLLVIAAIGFYITRSLRDFKGYLAWKKSQKQPEMGYMQHQYTSPTPSTPMYFDEHGQSSLVPPNSVVMKSELPSTNDVTTPRELDISPR